MNKSDEYKQIIVNSLKVLSGVCDGAVKRDSIGFNKFDSQFGRDLAELGDNISERQLRAAHEMLCKYRAQLSLYGIQLPEYHKTENKRDNNKLTARYKDGVMAVSFQYDPNTVDKIKIIPERRWNKDLKYWEIPLKYYDNLTNLFDNIDFDEKIKNEVRNLKERSTINNSASASADFDLKLKGGELYPFQKAGIEFIEKTNGRCIVADEMGLGKTIQAIGYLQLHRELRPAMIVCPASLKLNWLSEIRRWLDTDDRISVINGRKTFDLELTGATIIILNYDILYEWGKEIAKYKPAIIIYDEAHYMKAGNNSLRGKAGLGLSKIANRVIFITGTPVTNRPIELLPLLKMVSPKDWGNDWAYKQRYCGAFHNGYGWDFRGASNIDELHRMIAPWLLRRLKSDVLNELPEKTFASLIIDYDESAKKEYREVYIGAKKLIKDSLASRRPENALAEIERLKQAAVHAKMPAVKEWIKDFIETGQKLVIFANHKFVIDELMEEFGEYSVKYTGDTSQNERAELVKQFQENENVKLFIGNIKAAGVGITLTAASNVIFIEFPWTPADLIQAADRLHRIGQKNNVTVWYMIAADTIEGDIIELLEKKRKIVDSIHDGKISDNNIDIFDELTKRLISSFD